MWRFRSQSLGIDCLPKAAHKLARAFGKGVEKFLKAFGLAEFAGEDGMDGRH
jgi:hypothetical protein